MGGRKGKGQQEQNAPRAKNLARAPPRAVPRVYCMRREGANAAGRREEGGERRVERDRDAAPAEKRNHQIFRGCSGRDPGEKEQNLVCNGQIFADL